MAGGQKKDGVGVDRIENENYEKKFTNSQSENLKENFF